MTVSNPTALSGFWSRLRLQSVQWMLSSNVVSSRTEGGETITAERGTRLWRASVSLKPMYHREAEEIRARIQLQAGADRSFLCYPMPVCSPAYDADGAIIGGYSPTLLSIASNRIQIGLANMPPGYRLGGGEFLAFQYGSNPVRYALHQIVASEPVADAVTGETPLFEVRPAIRPGASVGAAVTLYRPPMRAQIERDSISYGTSQGAVVTGISFSLIQTLRG